MTGKQRAFIDNYILTLNATEAARLAGYKGDNNTLAVVGYENLRNPKIAAQIDSRMAKLTISANETLARVTQQATGSLADFLIIDSSGNASIDFAKAQSAGKLGLVKKYSETEVSRTTKDGEVISTKRVNIELYPADAALDKLMRYHSLYNDKIVLTWQEEIVGLLREGRVTQADVIGELGYDLAEELFKSAGILAVTSGEA
jgi:phage terminase small subunit